MMDAPHGPTRHRRIGKITALTGGLTALVVGLTVVNAGASTPAGDEVDRAAEVAERAAATESSVRTLRLDNAARDAEDIAHRHADSMLQAAENFEELTFPSVPEDWVAAGLDPDKATPNDRGEMVQELPDGSKVVLTIDPEVQEYAESVLDRHPVPHGGVVLVDPPTGRVIAMADRSRRDDDYTELSRNAQPPSASVFKVVTAAALLEETEQGADTQVCYHGGTRGLSKRNITGHPELDNRCDNLEGALAKSINSLIAKQTYHNLSEHQLLQWAERFGYNQPIPFELPIEPSTAHFENDPYELARAAAGFWHTHLSPLHGALIGAALANDGVMMKPTIIDRYKSPDGEVLYRSEPEVFREVMEAETADKLADMMKATTTRGTARNYFQHRRAFPRNIEVSGKTGTLSAQNPFLRFTWFVGFGEHSQWDDHPGVAVAGLMANDPQWYIRGPRAASDALRHYFSIQEQRRQMRQETIVER